MKHLIQVLFFSLVASYTFAQAPTLINYQGIARDNQFEPLTDQSIGLELKLVDLSTGTEAYVEEHKVITNQGGLFNLQIGSGSNKVGDLANIDWANTTYNLEVSMDEAGGNNYMFIGSSSLISVPYALHASTVEFNDDADANPANELQTISRSGNIITLSNGGGDVTDEVNDNDSDPNNEIQVVSFDVATNTLFLSGGGSVSLETLDNDNGGTNSGTDNQQISLSGTILSIEDGNSVDLKTVQDGVIDSDADPANEIQTLSKNGLQINLSSGGSITDEINDADADPNNELQTINKNGDVVTLSNGGGSFTDLVTDADADPNNELQTINKNGAVVTLSNGGGSFTDLVNDADADPQNELQMLSKNGLQINLSNGGSIQDEVDDADSNPINELQFITKVGNLVELTNGGGTFIDEVDDADADAQNEIQVLDLNGTMLSLSQSNSVDLSGLGGGGNSPWVPGASNSIIYTSGDVITNTQVVDGFVKVGDENADHIQLDASGMFIDNVAQTNCISQMTGGSVFFSDPGFNQTGSLGKDSLTIFTRGVGLLTDEYGSLKSYGLTFSSLFDKSTLDSRGLFLNDGSQNVYFSQYGLFNEKILSPSDTYTSYSLQSDSLNMYNSAKWETVKLGSNKDSNGGELRLSLNGFPIINAYTDANANGTIEINHLNKQGVFLGSFEEGGLINTQGKNGFQNTYVGSSIINPLDDHGGMGVMNSIGLIRAGLEVDLDGNGYVYSKGSVNILSDAEDQLGRFDGYGVDVFDDSGNFVASLSKDLFNQSTGLLNLNGQNNFNNVFAGANYNFGGDVNRGFVGVADELGDYKSMLFVDTNNDGHVHTDYVNIGGVPANSGLYPLNIQCNPLYGIALQSNDMTQTWEHHINSDDDLNLYSNNNLIGSFDPVTGAYTQLSDRRAKQNIKPLSNLLSRVGLLKPSTYEYIENNDTGKESLGFIAQEVQEIFPLLVKEVTQKDGSKKLTLDYAGFSVLAIQGINEQQAIIEKQQNKIESLEERIRKIELLLEK